MKTIMWLAVIGIFTAFSVNWHQHKDPPLICYWEPRYRVVNMKVTAYCPCEKCCGHWASVPASAKATAGKPGKPFGSAQGKRVTSRGKDAFVCDGVAADPKLLPYRTKLEIPGVGIREVDDTGGAMRQDGKKNIFHIDVRFTSHQEALNWGVQWLDVKVLQNAQVAQTGERR